MAEQAYEKALEARHVITMPEVTPLELAHLVAAMGLGDRDDGPAKALSLVSRSATYIEDKKAELKRLEDAIAEHNANWARMIAALGLSEEEANKTFSIDQVIARLPLDRLKVAGKTLRGKGLWNEFCRQIDLTPRPQEQSGKDDGSPEAYSLSDLYRIHQKFIEWREKIASKNIAKGAKNLKVVSRERREEAQKGGAEAVDAAPLPEFLK